jgi:hypothetical protein
MNKIFGSQVTPIGYSAGAGGIVTQGTNKATGVTINKCCGEITTHNATLNAATIVSFAVTDSCVKDTDLVAVEHDSGGTLGSYTVCANTVAAGSFQISIRNNTAGNLGEALAIRFVVIRAVEA